MSQITGATIGMFDGLHRGHQYLISQLKKLSDKALVVTFPNHPLWVVTGDRQPQLLSTPEEKIEALTSLGVTPILLEFDSSLRHMTGEEFINMLAQEYGIKRLLFGFNNSIGSDRCRIDADERLQASTGVEIIRAGELPGDYIINSSTIRKLITSGDIDKATNLLGHKYAIYGTVVHGKAIGREIGFPTANILVNNSDKIIPATGVYVADAITPEGNKFRAVVNIGHRPTIENTVTPVTIEAHLDDFTGDLYNQSLTLQFISRLRGEKKFTSLDELKSAIAYDLTSARTL